MFTIMLNLTWVTTTGVGVAQSGRCPGTDLLDIFCTCFLDLTRLSLPPISQTKRFTSLFSFI